MSNETKKKAVPTWCVTAKSKLTDRRERISIVSADRTVIEGICEQYKKHKYRRKPYTDPKVEVFTRDLFDD